MRLAGTRPIGYHGSTMRRLPLPARAGLVLLAALYSCSAKQKTGPGEDTEATRAALATLEAPLDIQGFQVVNADGHKSVFFKLSRLPDGVESYGESDPARIVIDIKGPTGQEVPEQFFPGKDNFVSYVRISSRYGAVRIVLDLQAANPPPFTVLPMADWLMVRLGPAQTSLAPSSLPRLAKEGWGGDQFSTHAAQQGS